MANRLKIIREKAGITQTELSRISGFRQSSLSRWESNSYDPNLSSAKRLAAALRCKIEDLVQPTR